MTTLNQEIEQFRLTPNGQIIQGASHTCRVLNHRVRNKYVIQTFCDLRKSDAIFDAIACTGTSGLMIVPQVAELLDKHICIVRNTEDCYSEFPVEGVCPHRYIIVDDLICSGNTVKRIIKAMKDQYPRAICSGVYTYIKDECAYRQNPKLCERDLRIPYLSV